MTKLSLTRELRISVRIWTECAESPCVVLSYRIASYRIIFFLHCVFPIVILDVVLVIAVKPFLSQASGVTSGTAAGTSSTGTQATGTKLSLKCPITLQRVCLPTRGQHCSHLQVNSSLFTSKANHLYKYHHWCSLYLPYNPVVWYITYRYILYIFDLYIFQSLCAHKISFVQHFIRTRHSSVMDLKMCMKYVRKRFWKEHLWAIQIFLCAFVSWLLCACAQLRGNIANSESEFIGLHVQCLCCTVGRQRLTQAQQTATMFHRNCFSLWLSVFLFFFFCSGLIWKPTCDWTANAVSGNVPSASTFIHSFILFLYCFFKSTTTQRHGYCVGVSCRSATGNCEWRTWPRFLRGS